MTVTNITTDSYCKIQFSLTHTHTSPQQVIQQTKTEEAKTNTLTQEIIQNYWEENSSKRQDRLLL